MPVLVALLLAAPPTLELRSSVDGGKPVPGWVYARVGQRVELRAMLAGATAETVRWFKLEPTTTSVDNTQPSFHFATIDYRETELPACRDALTCPADVTPTALPAVPALAGAGTMAFQVRVTLKGGGALATPGLEATKYGGLTRAVHRVTFRRDDTLIGYASELLNTPYIFGSAGPDGRNQSDLLIGSDCADLVIYGRRRMGRAASYTSSYELDRQALPLQKGARPREGDVLHFPGARHVGILFRDNEPRGVIDPGDLLLHTCWAPPTVQPLADKPCAAEVSDVRVLRFPD